MDLKSPATVSEMSCRVTRSMSRRESEKSTRSPADVTVAKRKAGTRRLPAGRVLPAPRTAPIQNEHFGLVQESVGTDLYKLLVAAVLWNRTRGVQARPVFLKLTSNYPSPEDLAEASISHLSDLLHPLGLHNSRARRLVAFAKAWVQNPPSKSRRYRKLHYPFRGDGLDIGKNQVLAEDDEREGWEVAHLPSLGPYALDSFRIFHRDILRGLAEDWNGKGAGPGFEPEWKRVAPMDKDLRAYIRWRWLKEGWVWDAETGTKVRASKK
ncbi:ENDO3c domain-containing protein [Fusarium keratoplasticum]|uniref:ENDO3c domain-containing protein n=1 Tax=Fusarium keratoplasticum TaxID=1328300 RepID=A0ACC0R5S9_9HYPO|nr:ENDO3c domain-containing protein [Fusarium keratoplasticum]KAI8674430.1 ENDO3c domain-containing protein [Fusarium keratoplasticum]